MKNSIDCLFFVHSTPTFGSKIQATCLTKLGPILLWSKLRSTQVYQWKQGIKSLSGPLSGSSIEIWQTFNNLCCCLNSDIAAVSLDLDGSLKGTQVKQSKQRTKASVWAAKCAKCWTNYFATMFRLHWTARSSTAMFADLLLACYLANATCAIINIMTTLIFIILIVSRLHAFFLVVAVRSSLHMLVAVAAISYFQHTPAVRSNEICFNLFSRSIVILTWQWSPFPIMLSLFAACGTMNLSPLLNVRANSSLSTSSSMSFIAAWCWRTRVTHDRRTCWK